MNKKQAAEFLGVSEKTIERAVKKGELAARYVRGKHGQMPAFDLAELERFGARRDAILHAPELIYDQPAVALTAVRSEPPTTSDHRPTADRQPDFSLLVAAFVEAFDRRNSPLLSIREAAQAFNISQSAINQAIKSGHIRKFKIGARGASVVRRGDVEEWIASL